MIELTHCCKLLQECQIPGGVAVERTATRLHCTAMKLIGIEPTPNPNSMKLVLDETLAPGVKATYRAADEVSAPLMRGLLSIAGVASIFHSSDFMAVQRTPGTDWQKILAQVRTVFDAATGVNAEVAVPRTDAPAQELLVSMQVFRDIPMQVKVIGGGAEIRRGLGRRFDAAAKRAMPAARNPLMERRWVELGTRYGDSEEVAANVVAEVRALYDSDRLARLSERALSSDHDEPEAQPDRQRLIRDLDDPDWRARYRALRRLGADAGLRKIIALAGDAHLSVRRQAIVLLGLFKDERALAPLRDALRDPIAAVRRTAGDALTDLGDPEVAGAIAETLADSSALVRWRAARFLFELGDERSLPSLRAARDDQVFEVRMQIEQAIERIESGARPEGPVWQRMTGSDRDSDGARP